MKVLNIELYNKLNEEVICTSVFPINAKKAMRGFYSNWYKIMKIKMASNQKIPSNLIKAKIQYTKQKGNEAIFKLPSGMALRFPEDLTPFDIKIILKQLEVLKMPFQKTE